MPDETYTSSERRAIDGSRLDDDLVTPRPALEQRIAAHARLTDPDRPSSEARLAIDPFEARRS